MTLDSFDTICCDMPKTKTKSKESDDPELIREWPLPVVATLGSGVRLKGILQEIRSRLPSPVRKSLDMQAGARLMTLPFVMEPSLPGKPKKPLNLSATLRQVRNPIIEVECRACGRTGSYVRAELVKKHRRKRDVRKAPADVSAWL
ncbi:hypothetical protein [Rhizobium sullae]|uniref:hypothetical protein n=1 Tax=Rhizobium sullae TaxID=50338 RepID=UPI001FCDA753|nr:hypothetical protein [Rhizobium sullae]